MLDEKGRYSGDCGGAGPDVATTVPFENATKDKRPVLIVLHQEHSSPGAIGQWFIANGYPLDIKRPRFGCELPSTLAHHAGAIVFGGPMSANDSDDWLRKEIGLIEVALKEQAPFLGVCLGAQMMARLLGANVSLHPEGIVEIGYHPVTPTEEGKSICSWPGCFYQWHKEGFELPAGARLLAKGGNAFPNQAFAYGPAAYGVQFHSEITYTMINRWTARNAARLEQKGAQAREAQLEAHMMHQGKVRAWLDRFLPHMLASRSAVAA